MKYRFTFSNLMYWITKPYKNIRNRFLAKRYPWLVPWVGWVRDEQIYNYSIAKYLMAEPDNGGWNKTIFYPMMRSIRKAAKKARIINDIHISEYKSKYGGLRCYLEGGNDEINEIISTYETLTEYICETCGKPDVGYTEGWITPICKKCYNRHRGQKTYEEVIKGVGRMPHWREYIKFEEDKKIHYKVDISVTANKLRKRWNIRHPFRRTTYDTEF